MARRVYDIPVNINFGTTEGAVTVRVLIEVEEQEWEPIAEGHAAEERAVELIRPFLRDNARLRVDDRASIPVEVHT